MSSTYDLGYDEGPYDSFGYGRNVSLVGSDLSIVRLERLGYGESPYGEFPYGGDGSYWFWFTEWVDEEQITDDQNTIATITYLDDDANPPVCDFAVEYKDELTANPQIRSPFLPVENESVTEITEVPYDPTGYYRLVITQYTGEQTIDHMNIGFIH